MHKQYVCTQRGVNGKEEATWEKTEPHCWKAKLQLNAATAAAVDIGPSIEERMLPPLSQSLSVTSTADN